MDRIGLLVELLGSEKVLRSLNDIAKASNELNNKKISLAVDKASLDREISGARKALADFTNQKRQIRLDMAEASKIDREIKRVKSSLDDLEKKRAVEIHADRIAIIDRQALSLMQRLVELEKKREVLLGADDLAKVEKKILETRATLDDLTQKKHELNIEASLNAEGIRQAQGAIQELEKSAQSAKDTIASIGDVFSSIGSGLQSIGGIFDTDILSYATASLTHRAMGALLSNTQDATQRFDILNTYTGYMDIMGVASDKAADSLAKINENIQGLPIGLDQVAFQTRKYNMYLDDVNEATDLAIGLNKALVAGGASSQMQNYAAYEIDRLLAVGKLATARQWNSLLQGLGVSTRFLKEEMGYAGLSTNEFVAQLSDGSISTQEFLSGLESLAQSDALESALDIYRTTIESGLSNIRFAITRGKANVFAALDESLQAATGKNISGYMLDVRDALNELFAGVSEWIRANPDKLESIIERVKGIFQRLGAFDWGGLAESIGNSLGKFVDILTWIYDHIPPQLIEYFLTFAMVWATPLGKAFSAIGRLIGGLARINWPGGGIFGRMSSSMSGLGRAMGSFKDILKGFVGGTAFMALLAELGLVIRQYAHLVEEIGAIDTGKFSKNLPKVAELLGTSGLVTGIITAIMSIANKVGGAGNIIIGEIETAGIFALMDYAGSIISKFTEIAQQVNDADLNSFDANYKKVESMIQKAGTAVGVITGVSGLLSATVIGGIAELAGTGITALIMENMRTAGELISQFTEVASEVANADMPTDAQIARLEEVFDELEKVFSGDMMTLNIDEGKLSAINDGLQTVKKVAESIDEFKEIEGIDVDFENIRNKVEEVAKAIADIFTMFSDAFGGIEGNAEAESASQAKIVENMSKVIKNLGDVATSFREIRTAVDRLGIDLEDHGVLSTTSDFYRLKNQVEEVGKAVGEIFNAIKDAFGGSWWWTKSQSKSQIGIVENMNNVLTNLDSTITAFNQLQSRIGLIGAHGEYSLEDFELGNWFTGKISGKRRVYEDDPFQSMVTQIEQMAEGMGRVSEAIDDSLTPLGSKFEEIQASLQTDIVEHWNETINAIQTLVTSMSEIDFHDDELGIGQQQWQGTKFEKTFVKKIENVANGMQEILAAIDPEGTVFGLIHTWFSDKKSDFQNDIVKNWSEIVGSIQDVITAFDAINTDSLGVNQYTGAKKGETAFDKKLADIKTVLEGVKETLSTLLGEQGLFKSISDMWTKANEEKQVESMTKSMEYISTIIENVDAAMEGINDLDMDGLEAFKENMKTLTTSVSEIMAQMTGTGLEDGGNLGSYTDLAKNLEQVVLGMEQIRAAVREIFRMQHMLEDVIDTDATGNLKTVVEGITGIFDGIEDDLSEISNKAYTVKGMVDQINEMVTTLADMKSNLESVLGGETTVAKQIGNVVSGITTALGTDEIETARQTVNDMNSVIRELNTALVNLQSVDLSALGDSMSNVMGQADALEEHLRNLSSALEEVSDNAKSAKRELANVGNMASGQVGKFSGLIQTLGTLSGALQAAARQASALRNAINAIPNTKNVSINYSSSGNRLRTTGVQESKGGLIPRRYSTGGYVTTLTDNGIVDMRKVGTDTVPTMLTPGEFVVKKASVDKFGTRFFEKINGMDFNGAIDAIMSRVNIPTGGVVNYYYTQNHDNHAQFTQNFYHDTQNHAPARAFRYLRAYS